MTYSSTVTGKEPSAEVDESTEAGSEVSNEPLSTSEHTAMVDMLMASMGLTRAQAEKFIANLSPKEARTFLGLMDGSDSITREEAIAMWDLTPEEANILFPDNKPISTFTNPFGQAFTMFLMLTYALELDLKAILAEVLQVQKDESIAKAEDLFDGATVQFAAALTAALVTGVFAGKSMFKAYKASKTPPPDPKNPNQTASQNNAATDNMWFGPIGASLITQPISAGGEFGNSWYQREGAYHDANTEEARGLYQQIMSLYDTTGQLSRSVAQNL